MRVIGYTRVSTKDQAESGLGLESQEKKIRAYCDLYELELIRIERDAGYTGKDLDRPGLQEALRDLKAGEAEGLVVAKLDRLTRRVVDAGRLIDDYFSERCPFALCCVADQVDTRTAAGRLVLNVLISVAQWEAETIGERTRAALDVKREKGQRIGGIPFGYQLAADGAQLELNRSERRIIEHIRLRYEQGYSQRRIVNELKHMGFVGRTGKPLSLMQVQRILKNKGD